MQIRQPAVADQFYPAEPQALKQLVADYVAAAQVEQIVPKAVIAPHAGYIYSGPIAGSAYAYVRNGVGLYRRVVIIGPAHRMAFRGVALPQATAFSTPLGVINIDEAARGALRDFPFVHENDAPHAQEHCLEVQLPFLQLSLNDFTIVPLLVGLVQPELIATLIARLAEDQQTLIVISTDLSHYLSYHDACTLDKLTVQAIEGQQPDQLQSEQACGCLPVQGLLLWTKQNDLRVRAVHVANSGDTAGPRNQVVGYGSFIVY